MGFHKSIIEEDLVNEGFRSARPGKISAILLEGGETLSPFRGGMAKLRGLKTDEKKAPRTRGRYSETRSIEGFQREKEPYDHRRFPLETRKRCHRLDQASDHRGAVVGALAVFLLGDFFCACILKLCVPALLLRPESRGSGCTGEDFLSRFLPFRF